MHTTVHLQLLLLLTIVCLFHVLTTIPLFPVLTIVRLFPVLTTVRPVLTTVRLLLSIPLSVGALSSGVRVLVVDFCQRRQSQFSGVAEFGVDTRCRRFSALLHELRRRSIRTKQQMGGWKQMKKSHTFFFRALFLYSI